jgi:hypothetical protein
METEEWLGPWLAGIEGSAERARAFAERAAQVSATASGPDNAVRVTVAASGAVTDLWLDDRVRQWPADRISKAVLATMRRAQGGLAAKVADVAAQTVGEDSSVGRDVVEDYARRFPAPAGRTQAGASTGPHAVSG